MPLARRLLIIAAVEGLLLTPLPHSNSSSRRGTPAGSRATSPSVVTPPGTVQIEYKTANVKATLTSKDGLRKKEEGLEVHGIAGLLNVTPTSSFLIAITSRQQVALINRVPVYVITDVALIPLSSQHAAQEALSKAKAGLLKHAAEGNAADISDDDDGLLYESEEEREKDAPSIAAGGVGNSAKTTERKPSDNVGIGGVYGLFAQKWFSKSGWTAPHKGSKDSTATSSSKKAPEIAVDSAGDEPGNSDSVSAEPHGVEADTNLGANAGEASSSKPENRPADELESFPALPMSEEEQADQKLQVQNTKEDVVHSLTPKLLHTTKILLAASRSFFFSYDHDITRSLLNQRQQGHKDDLTAPLYTRVDPLYFWNRHLQRPFITAGQHSFVLPLMQGFVAQRTFYADVTAPSTASDVDPEAAQPDKPASAKQPFILTLITRRSTKRAGLRYLRRGVDSEGNVANCVETEQLLSVPSSIQEGKNVAPEQLPWQRSYSLVQMRGSIPVYFQQSPYALKPKPVLLHSEATNHMAFAKHFEGLEKRYNGDIFCVSLVERGSAENIVGDKYEKYVSNLNEQRKPLDGTRQVGFNWFDFHKVCRGMKFEKVSVLIDEINGTLENFGWTETDIEGQTRSIQKGVVRTNCMDCLDRTNVVQSACARRVLETQLLKEGVDLSADPTEWFNLIWADNGDAVSKQYASTAALKGDFTRTRKRNYRGALTDFGLTMSRYFTNIISDFFTQAAIDFLLGNVSSRVFDEFEAQMMSRDPADSGGGWGVGGVRANAVDISSKIVIADDNEKLIKGWTFLTPHEPNTLRTFPFQETVLLLTSQALYVCRFDFALEKVSEFERIALGHVVSITQGAYITSTLASAETDEHTNVGFVVQFRVGKGEVRRVNTRTVHTASSSSSTHGESHVEREDSTIATEDGVRFVAFKALPQSSSALPDHPEDAGDSSTTTVKDPPPEQHVREVTQEIASHVMEARTAPLPEGEELIKNEDVISLAAAKKKTGLLEMWGYQVRRLVWA